MQEKTYEVFLKTTRNGLLYRVGVPLNQYRAYLETIRQHDRHYPPSSPPPPLSHTAEFIRATIQPLLEDDAVREVVACAGELDSSVGKALEAELKYFNSRYEEPSAFDSDDATTAKNSIEDLLPNLPKKIKDLLTVLNQLLKLIRG